MSDNDENKASHDDSGASSVTRGLQGAKDALAAKMVQIAHKEAETQQQETVYNVVFTGNFTKNEKQAIEMMAKFFKQGVEATKRLLQPGRVIKSFPNKAPADKLTRMLLNAGLECKVELEVIGEPEESSLLEKAAFKLDDAHIPSVHMPKFKELSKTQIGTGAAALLAIIGLITWLILKPPIVDGDSFETFEASVAKVLDRAPDDQKAALQKSIDLLTGAGFEYQKRNTFGGNEEVAANIAYGRIKGMNAKEIIVAAEIELEKKRKWFLDEIELTKQRIKEAEAEIAELEPENDQLKKLVITEPRYYWIKGDAPQIDFKVTNNTNARISRLFFQGYLYDSNGNLVVSKDFSYSVAIGLRPKQSKYIPLYTKPDGVWANQTIKKQWRAAKFRATVENAENMKGKPIGIDLRPYRQKITDGQKRIAELEKQLKNIGL